jgi:hypothetical protein
MPGSNGLRAVGDILASKGYNGWRVVQSTAAEQDGVWVNTGTWSGSNPYVTSTATDKAEFTFVGVELMVRFSTASGDAAVVDVVVDGVTTQTNLALSALPSVYQPFLLVASGLSKAQHKVTITLKSGTLKIYQAAWLLANIAGTTATLRKMVPARWYGQQPYTPATTAPAAGTATVVPFYVPALRTFTDLACDITTLAAGATVALGIYGSDEYDQPLGLIVDAGTVDAGSTGFKSLTLTGVVLQPGWHWLAALSLGGAPAMRSNTSTHELVTTAANSTASALNGYTHAGQSALPKRWTSTAAGGNSPRVIAKPN